MGKAKFWPPGGWGSETPQRISMKLGIYNHVVSMTTHANPCGAETTWVVWANTWKNICWGFLGIPFLALYFGSRRARTSGPILTIYTSCDVFPPKDVPFGSRSYCSPFGGKIPPKKTILAAWIGIFKLNVQNTKFSYYRNYCADYNQILHSHKDHQILFVGGPNTRKTNPRWRTAAILKNGKSAGWLVGWSLTALSTQCRSYRAFKVRLY